ncbi:hypothetical protein C2G38_2153267 [Gigaspora rosea]|uniref:Uncharacterized protein n=1 Tax=Gigaspora rosea TaxID=44941 RepID=A0A397W870_9GLOM|nr:hypothetical protein C2G38_2153267 [Gigaspora rosea]
MEQERVENAGPLQNDENRRTPIDDPPIYRIVNDDRNNPSAQEPLHAVLREIANAFREASAGVAAAARPRCEKQIWYVLNPSVERKMRAPSSG